MTPAPIADQEQRAAAINPRRSFIVQAPAGSGKTELLIQRFLALLGRVDRPQQVLAITFTRKAAAEMRHRLLSALESAQDDTPPEESHRLLTWQLARQALQQDKNLTWNLLQNPSLLSIQTIDSFNASLVRRMPWLTRLGGVPDLAESPEQLYLAAAENLLNRLGTAHPGCDQLKLLMAHLDNRMDRLQQMLVDMLRKRDQWLRHLVGIKSENSRCLLESGLKQLVESCLAGLAEHLPAAFHEELLACGRTAAANLWDQGERPLLCLTDLDWLPAAAVEHLAVWQGIADLLLTGGGDLRKPGGVNVKLGFPTSDKPAKERMQQLLRSLEGSPEFVSRLAQTRELPTCRYGEGQWRVLQALIELLPLLVGELWLVFRSEGQADFSEIALKAQQALGSVDDPSDLLLKLDNGLQHILVDEFQDTSWLQYDLLKVLTAGWQNGDGRTLFLVGDPMQSIYRFREAEVGLFLRTFQRGLGESGVLLEPLRLSCNFRSQQGIVEWVNRSFSAIFPRQVDEASGAVPVAEAVAVREVLPGAACCLHAFNGRDDSAEADRVVDLVRRARTENPSQRVAILVRSRTHLPEILHLLRHNGLSYQAQDIDLLGERPAALDILALTRALLHRGDRLAWLTVLRAPWCALRLVDLHALVDGAPRATVPTLLQSSDRLQQLSEDAKKRVGRILPILETGMTRRGRLPLRQLVEACWLALGGPACYDHEGVEDAALVFDLLETLQQGGDLPALDSLEKGLATLFSAPDTNADASLQVMTIHKAKGLEFDQVILPGLGRKPRSGDAALLRWLEHPEFGLLLAPIAPRDGSEQDPIYKLIGKLEKEKQDLETARLLYVAATRARNRLHLLGSARENAGGELKPDRGSLLETLWPVVEAEFADQALACENEVTASIVLPLRRLPLDWQQPELTAAPLPKVVDVGKASDVDGQDEDVPFTGWEQQSRRHIGTLVHALLEQVALQGIDSWLSRDTEPRNSMLERQLSALGVPRPELPVALERTLRAVQKTVESQRGRWILERHEQADCELALSGLVEGRVIHAVIDRTFIADGVRWVIDYKTSSPQQGETEEAFVLREKDHYRRQMESYVELMRAMDPGRVVWAALYFPLCDQWIEYS
ncbi:MAG: UvrD-helicase domain-containing protein [Desulfuromonadales bacterium]|nr:UvrD-helicase domain-containing protein [Desulfuromonadales bacterium]